MLSWPSGVAGQRDYLVVVVWDTTLPSFVSSVTTMTFVVEDFEEPPPAPKLWERREVQFDLMMTEPRHFLLQAAAP